MNSILGSLHFYNSVIDIFQKCDIEKRQKDVLWSSWNCSYRSVWSFKNQFSRFNCNKNKSPTKPEHTTDNENNNHGSGQRRDINPYNAVHQVRRQCGCERDDVAPGGLNEEQNRTIGNVVASRRIPLSGGQLVTSSIRMVQHVVTKCICWVLNRNRSDINLEIKLIFQSWWNCYNQTNSIFQTTNDKL